jgi:hypothetical protein
MAELSGLFNRGIRKLQLFGRIRRLNKMIGPHIVPEENKSRFKAVAGDLLSHLGYEENDQDW